MNSDRHQQSLQGVLRFAIANSVCEDEIDPSRCERMDMERKEFLENALKSMTVDVIEELEKAVQILAKPTSSIEDRVEALNIVRDYAGNIDFANNFINVGGSKVVLDCLSSSNSKLKICSAYVIAELSQNNPFCQQHFLDKGTLSLLMTLTRDEGDVASSALHAISSIVRNFEAGSSKFIEKGGLQCIVERLHSRHSNVFVKSCFLLRALASEYPAVKEKFVELGAVPKLADCVDMVSGFDLKIEIVLNALCVLCESDVGKAHLRETDISEMLQELINVNDGKAECEEILRDSTLLLEWIAMQ